MATDTTGAFSGLLAPGQRKIFFDQYTKRPTEYSHVANMGSSKRNYEEDRRFAGLPAVPIKPQGVSTTYENLLQGEAKRYTHDSYGLGYRVTTELYQDDLYGVINKAPKAMGRSAAHAIETAFWAVFNNAFAASPAVKFQGFDGKSLCNTAHLRVDGSTYANRPSTDTDVDISALQQAVDNFENMTDERGLPILLVPKFLVVAPENKWVVREIIGSGYKPYTANNEINPLVDEELQYFVCHYFTDKDMWFLVANKGDHDINFFWRQELVFDHGDDFDTGDAKFKCFMRFIAGHGDPRGIYGSAGA